MHAGEWPNCGYMMLVGGISHLCVCPSGMTPCSTPPALMRIWTIDTHRHTHIGTYTPLRRNSWKKLPTLLPILPPSWFLPSFPQSLRTHPGVHFSSLAPFSCLFSVLISPSIFESHWTAYRFTFSVIFIVRLNEQNYHKMLPTRNFINFFGEEE